MTFPPAVILKVAVVSGIFGWHRRYQNWKIFEKRCCVFRAEAEFNIRFDISFLTPLLAELLELKALMTDRAVMCRPW